MDYLREESELSHMTLFDVCGTLFYSNTTFDFLAFYYRRSSGYQRKIKWLTSLPAKIFFKVFYRLTHFDLLRYLAVYSLRGEKEVDIRQEVKSFVDILFQRHAVQPIIGVLQQTQEQRLHVGLISASLDIIIEEIAKRFNIKYWHASQLGFDKGICTGKIEVDLYGRKDKLVRRYAAEFADMVFITDNFNDLAIRNLVNDFRAVSFPKDRHFWEKRLSNNVIYEK
ncbi:HAD-IB family phosphatase [Olivibacter sp. CPCC 100613]|uniref:HAD family hydrolase n=1 Tax=Olivibacter sp. CPCC 100613 TaxID=3079931 RepID=UPI002FFBF5CC